jgi:hypothetical protein
MDDLYRQLWRESVFFDEMDAGLRGGPENQPPRIMMMHYYYGPKNESHYQDLLKREKADASMIQRAKQDWALHLSRLSPDRLEGMLAKAFFGPIKKYHEAEGPHHTRYVWPEQWRKERVRAFV